MNKTELVTYLMENAGLTKAQAQAAVDAFIGGVMDALKKGDKVTIPGFGVFSVRERAAREGINPLTKAKIQIKATKSAGFKASKTFKDLLN
ncbi:MAG: HU family DNA-binding protein [Bacilli bacterium]|jgi:DNA-binding protein HU-beta|nr:HU family DNA-binding protein [Bacilli bacterium]